MADATKPAHSLVHSSQGVLRGQPLGYGVRRVTDRTSTANSNWVSFRSKNSNSEREASQHDGGDPRPNQSKN
jgi:hypothetical protein